MSTRRHRRGDARALDLPRLEDDVAVGEDHRAPRPPEPPEHVERARVQPVRERIVHQERGHREEVDVERVLDAVALQRAEVVAVAELRHQVLEDRPVAVARAGAVFPLEVAPDVVLDEVVVEQRVVDVDEEDGGVGAHGLQQRGIRSPRDRYRPTIG
jgi:hypothetical protein